jgi:hypothetical protein
MDHTHEPTVDRRMLLRGLSLGLASSGAAAGSIIPARVARAYDPGPERRARYRETEHVKAFYRTNGYETLRK